MEGFIELARTLTRRSESISQHQREALEVFVFCQAIPSHVEDRCQTCYLWFKPGERPADEDQRCASCEAVSYCHRFGCNRPNYCGSCEQAICKECTEKCWHDDCKMSFCWSCARDQGPYCLNCGSVGCDQHMLNRWVCPNCR